jgi:hypothetical protein
MTENASEPDPGQSPHVEWHPFDYKNKNATRPPHSDPVWIVERSCSGGVDLGYFDGFTFCTINGSDDCHVTHWAEIGYPEPPAGWDDDKAEDDE